MAVDLPVPRDAAEGVFSLVTTGAVDTRAVASVLGGLLGGGEVIGLVGGLGAGKTCFVQGLALGLGVAPEAYVCSPTFALWNQHQGRVPLYHVDLYRLEDADEAAFIGYEDLFDAVAVLAIEWFERFPELWPRSYLRIALTEGPGPASAAGLYEVRGAAGAGSAADGGVDPQGLGADQSMDHERMTRDVIIKGVGDRHQELARRFRTALAGAGRTVTVGGQV